MATRDSRGRFSAVKVEKAASNGFPAGNQVNFVPSGATGLKQSHGWIYEEFLTELSGANAAKIFKEMRENDPVIGAMFFAFEMFMRGVKWYVDPPTDDEEGEKKAQFLRECKDDMSQTWSDFIAEVMTMLEHGWQWSEILYKIRTTDILPGKEDPESAYDDGRIGWRKFDPRAQDSLDRWDIDDQGGIRGMWQRPAPDFDEKYVPIGKSLLFRTTVKKNNPEGRSVLRNAYRPWYFKKRIEEIEGVGVERDLAGLPFAEVPAEMMSPNASDADKATLASIVELVKNVRRDQQEGVVWPQSWDENGNPQYQFKLMSSGGTRQFNTSDIITRYDSRILLVVLADFILLGNDSSGSFAMSTNKSGLFQRALAAWLDVVQSVLNDFAVPRLFRLNKWEGPYPKFRHEEVQKPALADLATFVAALTGAGAQLFPDVELENFFRDLGQMPLREAKVEAKGKEDELRDQKVDADIAAAKEAVKNPGGPVLGKQPGSVKGAATKTTGKVKSKLPPSNRRDTKATRAADNTVAKRRVVRRKKVVRK